MIENISQLREKVRTARAFIDSGSEWAFITGITKLTPAEFEKLSLEMENDDTDS